MPKILSRQPRWLDYSTPAFDFFQPAAKDKAKARKDDAQVDGPLKKIAHRGSEVFVAVGNELRWSDLPMLKDAEEDNRARYGRQEEPNKLPAYKILTTPVSRPITQLSVSPSGDYLAVLTSHTCHVCLIPPRENLRFQHQQPMKLRSYQVGPTAHVVEQAPLATALWHPLSPSGNALVTVTKDACVRLWELDHKNRSSYNEPALAVDLKKLANATTEREDFSASKYGANKGFSPDDVMMQVASSCFGGHGGEDEDGWSSMTLWVAMSEGDVYALCPFLPSKFWAPPTLLPSLSTSVIATTRVIEQDRQVPELRKIIAQQQRNWLAELDQQDPREVPGQFGFEVYTRPEKLSAVPRLQGPFQLTPEPDFGEITDIHVIAPKVNDEALFDDDDDDEDLDVSDGLSIGIVCLATNTSKVHICLNVEGVEAEWLPSRRSRIHYMDDLDAVKDLLLFETVDLARSGQPTQDEAWPTFTASPADRYEIFSTQPTGIYSMSLRPWIAGLEDELSTPQADGTGIGFRLDILLESSTTALQMLTSEFSEPLRNVNAAIAVQGIDNYDIGYVILTCASNHPIASLLDAPTDAAHVFAPDSLSPPDALATSESRPPYQPAEVFFQQSSLPAQIQAWRRESASGSSGDLKGQINFSAYTLQKITDAHRTLSSETHNMGLAISELFRQCARMSDEMLEQISKIKDLSNRVDSVTGEDEFPEQAAGEPELVRGGRYKMQKRIEDSQNRTQEIKERVERVRKKMRGVGGKGLSAKERAFAEEVAKVEKVVLEAPEAPTSPVALLTMEDSEVTTWTESRPDGAGKQVTMAGRFETVKELYAQLTAQAEAVQKELEGKTEDVAGLKRTTTGAQAGFRQQKLAQVFALLERETALVNGVSERLGNLQVATT